MATRPLTTLRRLWAFVLSAVLASLMIGVGVMTPVRAAGELTATANYFYTYHQLQFVSDYPSYGGILGLGLGANTTNQDLISYCVDPRSQINQEVMAGTQKLTNFDPTTAPYSLTNVNAIAWVLRNGLSTTINADALSTTVGVTRNLSTPDAWTNLAADVTSAAIWYWGFGYRVSPIYEYQTADTPAGLKAEQNTFFWNLYNYLTQAGRSAPLASSPVTASFSTNTVSGTAGQLLGPVTLTTSQSTAALTSNLPAGVVLTDASGTPLPASVPSGTAIYVKVPAGTAPGSYTITAAATGQSGSSVQVFDELAGQPNTQAMIGLVPGTSATAKTTSTVTWAAAPTLATSATDSNGSKIMPYAGGTLNDTITYTNLIPGHAYVLKGEVWNATDNVLTNITTTINPFTPTGASGTQIMNFTIPNGYAGKTLVVFETLYDTNGTTVVASHTDKTDAAQTVTVAAAPTIGTIATTDPGKTSHTLPDSGGAVTDTVNYSGLTPGTTYTLTGIMMDKQTNTAVGVSQSATFTATSATGSVDIVLTVPSGNAGKMLVAFETLTTVVNGNTVMVAEHKDLNDKGQTISVGVGLGTTATTDAGRTSHTLAYTGGAITDQVHYYGLNTSTSYTISGVLMDKGTGNPTTLTQTFGPFTPSSPEGVVDLVFTVPSGYAGKTLVAFETLSSVSPAATVAEHKDLNDAAQTVTVAVGLLTTATDTSDGDHTLLYTGGEIQDHVQYFGLSTTSSYTISGVLVDKATGVETLITATSAPFTPASPDGAVDVTFTVAAGNAGRTFVAFETLTTVVSGSTVTVAVHRDVNDAAQTVNVGLGLETTATTTNTDPKTLPFSGGFITDHVAYFGLSPNQTYTLSGVLMNKATGSATALTTSATFKPTTPDGAIDVTFSVPLGVYAGQTLVAFETLKNSSGTIVVEHKDINDAAQTITVGIGLATVATTDTARTSHVLPFDGGTVTDRVQYYGLSTTQSYTISGTLWDKATNQATPLTISSQPFTPTASSRYVEIAFTVPAGYAGKTLVAFETLKDSGGATIVEHKDINDVAQTVTVGPLPTVATTAKAADGSKILPYTGGNLIDTVDYTNLVIGRTYVIKGEVWNVTDDVSTGITANPISFTATTASGTQTMTFEIPATLAGKTLVVFETLYQSDGTTLIVAHADKNDAAQTVTVGLGLETSATTDVARTLQVLPYVGGRVTDRVRYYGLNTTQSYTISGLLMEQGTNQPTSITASSPSFTPTSSSGYVDIDFTVPTGYAGKTLVAFETLKDSGGATIVEHKDINDVAQTVTVAAPAVSTHARDASDGDQTLPVSGGVVNDEVSFAGLQPNVEYVINGELMDQATGLGTGIKASKKFTPTGSNGSVILSFTVPDSMAGKKLVVFEMLYEADGTTLLAKHTDIKDAAQTVAVQPPPAPLQGGMGLSRTGTDAQLIALIGLTSIFAGFVLVRSGRYRRRH